MSIQSEIERISGNIGDAYSACNDKGATMPTAENQNSANLADTISSIPAGGGGSADNSWFWTEISSLTLSPSSFDSTWIAEHTEFTYSNVYTHNFSSTLDMSHNNYVGFLFEDNFPNKFYVIASNSFTTLPYIKVPENTVVTEPSYTGSETTIMGWGKFLIDFTNSSEKWVIFPSSNIPDSIQNLSFSETVDSSSYLSIISKVKSLCIRYRTDTTGELSASGGVSGLLDTFGQYDKSLEDIYTNYTFTSIGYGTDPNSANCILRSISPKFDIEKFLEDYAPNVNFYGVAQGTATNSRKPFYSYYNTKGKYIFSTKKYPIILDFSTLSFNNSSATTMYMGSKTTQAYENTVKTSPIVEELFMIPSANFNIDWTVTDIKNQITPASLRFFADHSPSVSGKTLTIGTHNINAANLIDSTIITDIQAKGWTVA